MSNQTEVGEMSDAKGTMKRAEAEAKVQQALSKQRSAYLSLIATSITSQLDLLVQTDHDRLSVLTGLLSHLAVRGKAAWEELEGLLRKAYDYQTKVAAEQDAARVQVAQPEQPQAPA